MPDDRRDPSRSRHLLSGLTQFPSTSRLAALINAHAPACRDGAFHVETCRVTDVIAGRRDTLFALVDATVVHAFDGGRSSRRLVFQRFPDQASAVEEARKVFRRLRHRARTQGLKQDFRPWAGFIPEERVLLVPFPFDYRLPALVPACDPRTAGARLADLLGVEVTNCVVAPVRYVPHKRCQVRYDLTAADGATVSVFGKLRTANQSEREVAWMQSLHASFAAGGVAATPAPIGYVGDWGMLVQRAAPGETLYALQRNTQDRIEIYERTGEALAVLHTTPLDHLPSHLVPDELAMLLTMLQKTRLPPAELRTASEVLDWLTRTATLVPLSPAGTSHRDFYDKQVLAGPDGVWLIDFDTLAHAPHVIDVGNFIAHLRLRERQGYLTHHRARSAAIGFLNGYRRHRPVDDHAVDWCVAAALLRLAGVYVVRPEWSHLSGPLLADAMECLPMSSTVHRRVLCDERRTVAP
ncbi:MAG: aminoglycoside phosphotransferase family protein [Acidobacteria bacterium]|nr:aminoglycoside phosphotransferase family protein [Acidobacteriota bacterium]